MSIYIIGIGGTGAKCIEAIIQLAAIGLFSEETLHILFVDADENNGNLERSLKSLKIYQDCHNLSLADKHPWMKTKIESFGLWSPFANTSVNNNLGSFFEYNILKDDEPALGNLFDVLYTSEERDANLDVGFRGRPAIGAAVMSQVKLDLDYDSWGKMMNQLQKDTGGGKRPKVFLCGSIFGGTGASGLPTLGRLIHNNLDNLRIRSKIDLGCLFVLPYFGFTSALGYNLETVYARSEQFLLNTEAALRYYGSQTQETFDTVYLLGNQNLSPVKKFSVGKNTQCNDPHFIEFYGALAAREFLLNPTHGQKKVVLMNREKLKNLTWKDIPDQKEVNVELVNATRFSFTWLADIAPKLAEAKRIGVKDFQRGTEGAWFVKFFPERGQKKEVDFNDQDQQRAIEIITEWCRDYLRWLSQVHQCVDEKIQLFNANHFINSNLSPQNLSDLIAGQGDSRGKDQKSKDTIQKLKERLHPPAISLPNQGILGLAKALYLVSRL